MIKVNFVRPTLVVLVYVLLLQQIYGLQMAEELKITNITVEVDCIAMLTLAKDGCMEDN